MEHPCQGKLALCGAAVEAQVPGLQATVKTLPMENKSSIERGGQFILVLNAAQVEQVEVAWHGAREGAEGLQGWHAALLRQHRQGQDFVVQEHGGHVTEQRREADWLAVVHLLGAGSIDVGDERVKDGGDFGEKASMLSGEQQGQNGSNRKQKGN